MATELKAAELLNVTVAELNRRMEEPPELGKWKQWAQCQTAPAS